MGGGSWSRDEETFARDDVQAKLKANVYRAATSDRRMTKETGRIDKNRLILTIQSSRIGLSKPLIFCEPCSASLLP